MAEDAFPDRNMALRDKLAWMIETSGWLLGAAVSQRREVHCFAKHGNGSRPPAKG